MEKQPYVVFRKRHIFVLGKRRCFRKLVQFWKLSKTANLGHMAGPSTGMAPITWACPVMVQSGPVTRAQVIPSWRQSPGLVP